LLIINENLTKKKRGEVLGHKVLKKDQYLIIFESILKAFYFRNNFRKSKGKVK